MSPRHLKESFGGSDSRVGSLRVARGLVASIKAGTDTPILQNSSWDTSRAIGGPLGMHELWTWLSDLVKGSAVSGEGYLVFWVAGWVEGQTYRGATNVRPGQRGLGFRSIA